MCIKEGIEVGHVFTSPSGNTAKVLSLSGTSSRCTNPDQPIRAEIAYSYSFSSKAGIELSDDFKPSDLTEHERFNGFLLKATSNSIREHGLQISAVGKKPTLSAQMWANGIEKRVLENPKLSEAKSMNGETLTINGAPALRFEIAGTQKGLFGSKGTFLYTILEGDDEFVLVYVYAPTEYFEEHREELRQYAYRVRGLGAPAAVVAPPVASSQAPAPVAERHSSPLPSTNERLQQLNDLLKSGLITQDEYNAKKKDILNSL